MFDGNIAEFVYHADLLGHCRFILEAIILRWLVWGIVSSYFQVNKTHLHIKNDSLFNVHGIIL